MGSVDLNQEIINIFMAQTNFSYKTEHKKSIKSIQHDTSKKILTSTTDCIISIQK